MSDVTQGDAIAAVTEEGGSDAGRLLANIFESNAREQERLAERIQSGLESERDRWKGRALVAERRLERIEYRLSSLLD